MSSPARRDFDVVTYSCVVMKHLGSTIIEKAAAAGASPSPLPVLFRSLADPFRFSCLLALRERPRTIGQIAVTTGLRQPDVSKHLSRLRGGGLVRSERSGRFVTYGMVDPGVEELLDTAGVLLARVDGSIEEYPIHDGSAR